MIFKFEPHYFERVWGGQSLKEILSRKIPSNQKIGEAWDLVDREGCESLISLPQTSSNSIRNLLESHSEEIMGPGWDKHRRFPILVKWLDCTDRLSLQVHPPSSIASSLGGEPKTENWYILSASEEAGLFLGLKNGTTKQDFLHALENEELELVCNRLNSRAGSSVLVESGRMHAIDAGNLILEIQQNSDTTYRVYDWGRKDQFGKSRTYSDRTFSVTQSADYGKVYIYRSNYGSDSGLSSNYPAVMGIDTTDSSTPPEITGFSANDTSPMRLLSSSLGESTLSLAGGKQADLVATLSGSHLDTIISASSPYTMGGTAEQYIIVVPSGSDMIGIPTSLTDSFGGSTAGEYVMSINADGSGFGIESSTMHLLDTSGSINGYDKHFVIGRRGHNAASSVVIRLTESSGSIPS